jgi:Inhibitor of the KinA pathway to sporulation, predicted exonuclease
MQNYIVVDLEWNQSSSGKAGSNEKLTFEIIEIGAVKLNENFEKIDSFRRFIKPQVYKTMSIQSYAVTHLSMKDIQKAGIPFKQAVKEFLTWCGDDFIFCTWGESDIWELRRNMEYHEVSYKFPVPLLYYDIQKLFSLLYAAGKEKYSLELAAEVLNLVLKDNFHQALADAEYTAEILRCLDFNEVKQYVSLDYYELPKNRDTIIKLVFDNYAKYVSSVFDSKEEAFSEKAVLETHCYKCGKKLRRKVRWFPFNTKVYYCLANCSEHGIIKGRMRIKKSPDDRIFVVKILKIVGEKEAEEIINKKALVIKKRKERRRLQKDKEK